MTEKSHVAMGYYLCPVCLTKHTEVVVLDKKLKASLPPSVFVDWDLCKEHAKLSLENYVHIVEVSSEVTSMEQSVEVRTGKAASIRETIWNDIMNAPIPKNRFAFVNLGLIDKLQEMSGQPFIDMTQTEETSEVSISMTTVHPESSTLH
jgi:hypothetical protein